MTAPWPGQEGAQSTQAPPIKTCPHCSAQTQTFDQKCPHCGKSYIVKKKHTVRNVLLGITLLIILTFAGCAALIGGAATSVSNDLHKKQARSAITTTQWNSIKVGQSKAKVLQIVAPAVPSDEQTMESDSGTVNYNSNCLYFYKAEDKSFQVISYQVCLSNGKVESKSSY